MEIVALTQKLRNYQGKVGKVVKEDKQLPEYSNLTPKVES